MPILPISERTKLGGIMKVVDGILAMAERRGGSVPALLLFEPVKESGNPAARAAAPGAEAELVVLAFGHAMRDLVFQALKRVEAREPELQAGGRAATGGVRWGHAVERHVSANDGELSNGFQPHAGG